MSGKINLGKGSYCGGSTFGELNDVNIGHFSSIATGVIFDSGLNHNYNNLSQFPFNVIYPNYSHLSGHVTTKGDINIGSDVWVGRDSIIMSGVTIGDGAIIGAKSFVNKDVEPYSIVGGVPAKHIKYRFDKDKIDLFMKTKWWNWSDEEVDSIVPILMSNNFDAYTRACSSKIRKGKSIAIVTRSMNDKLYDMMKSTLPSYYTFIRITDCPGGEGAFKYITRMMEQPYDWIINIDEDMFIYSEESLLSLLDYMMDNNYDYCGMADGGMCVHRDHSPITMNTFFNIFNLNAIRSKLISYDEINKISYDPSMEKHIPNNLKEGYAWKNDLYEPYYPFFYWLPTTGLKPLYLQTYELPDNISTVVKNQSGEEIGIHTWYSRAYGVDSYHTNRISMLYNQAIKKA